MAESKHLSLDFTAPLCCKLLSVNSSFLVGKWRIIPNCGWMWQWMLTRSSARLWDSPSTQSQPNRFVITEDTLGFPFPTETAQKPLPGTRLAAGQLAVAGTQQVHVSEKKPMASRRLFLCRLPPPVFCAHDLDIQSILFYLNTSTCNSPLIGLLFICILSFIIFKLTQLENTTDKKSKFMPGTFFHPSIHPEISRGNLSCWNLLHTNHFQQGS